MDGNDKERSKTPEEIQKELIDRLNLLKKAGRPIDDDPELITRLFDATYPKNYFRPVLKNNLNTKHLLHRFNDDSPELLEDLVVEVWIDITNHWYDDSVFPENFLNDLFNDCFNERFKSYNETRKSSPLDENRPAQDLYSYHGYSRFDSAALIYRYYIEYDNTIYDPNDHSPVYNQKHKKRIDRKRRYLEDHLTEYDIENIARHPAGKVISEKSYDSRQEDRKIRKAKYKKNIRRHSAGKVISAKGSSK